MKNTIVLLLVITFLSSCNDKNKQESTTAKKDIEGTWRLISAETTEKDSTFSTFDPKTKMIKIINDSHFAFFNHDLNNGKKEGALFFGGGGKYTLKDSCPKVSYGKLMLENGKKTMAMTVLAHHSLVDGYHMGLFVDELQKLMNS